MWGSALIVAVAGLIFINTDIAANASLSNDENALLALSVVFIGLALSSLAVGRRAGPIDWFAIIYVMAGAYVLNFPLRLMYLMATGTGIGIFPYWDKLVEAMTYVLLGFGAMLLGYYVAFGDKVAQLLPSLNLKWQLSPSLGKLATLYFIGFGARLLLSLEIVSSTYMYYLIVLSYLTSFVLAVSIIYALVSPVNRGMWRAFVLVLMPFQFIYTFVWSPNKMAVIEPLYIFLICYHYLKNRMSLKLFVPAALIIAGVVFPVIAVYRDQSPLVYNTSIGIINTMEDLIRGGWQGYSDLVIDSVMRRSHLVDSVALVVKYSSIPDVLTGIGEYLRIPAYAFWPRAFWSDKPISQSQIFGIDYLGTTGMTSFGLSNPGDLYRNLGLAGLIVGMFVLGFIYRLVYEYFIGKHRGSPLPTLAPYLFIYIFVLEQLYLGFEVAISTGISELLRKLVLLLVVVLHLRAPSHSAPIRYYK